MLSDTEQCHLGKEGSNNQDKLENQLIEGIVEFAEPYNPKSPFCDGFEEGAFFLVQTSLSRFDVGFITTFENFGEHFKLDELDFIGKFTERQKWFREY